MTLLTVQSEMDDAASRVFDRLRKADDCLVLAESCTAGLISATLGRLPGVSEVLAGSAVVYQLRTKSEWLQIDPQLLISPGAVSRQVAEEMAVRVLRQTPQATVSLSITGHLGPDAPRDLDGTVWSAVSRHTGIIDTRQLAVATQEQWTERQTAGLGPGTGNETATALITPETHRAAWSDEGGMSLRQYRQCHAVILALKFLAEVLG